MKTKKLKLEKKSIKNFNKIALKELYRIKGGEDTTNDHWFETEGFVKKHPNYSN